MKTFKPQRRPAKIALALTWDGARWPIASLPPKARAFLQARGFSTPGRREVARLLSGEAVDEVRICWVPQLVGGESVLADPFPAPGGKRVAFRAAKMAQFGDVLAVVYQR